jgi:hypothetical protein
MKKCHLGPQNGPRSSGTEKLLKVVSFQKMALSQLDKLGGHQDPPGSADGIIKPDIEIGSIKHLQGEQVDQLGQWTYYPLTCRGN